MPNPYSPPQTEVEPPREAETHPEAGPPGPKPVIDPDDHFETLYTTNDLIEAEMLTHLLEGEGIATPGLNRAVGAAVGIGWNAATGYVIRVPSRRMAEARELLQAFQEGVPKEEDEPEDALPAKKQRPERRQGWFLTVGIVLFGTIATSWRACSIHP